MVPIKRFYKIVSTAASDGGWQVLLDARPLKTPAGAPLVIRSQTMAEAISVEWDAQREKIQPETMPFFRLLATSIDRVAPRRDDVVAATVKFGETDMLCYRADDPPALVQLQAQRWQPLIEWARDSIGAEFRVTTGILPVSQPPDALDAARAAVARFDDLGLTAVSNLAGVTGSLVLALALAHNRLDADEGGEVALLHEQFQADEWGEDAEARARRDLTRAEIRETTRFLTLIG